MGEKGIEPLRLKNHSSFTDWYYVANSRHSPTMGLVGLEPTIRWLKARCICRYATNPNNMENIRLSRCWWSLNHLYRIPPFGLWGEIGGHLGNCHKQQKRGGNFWFLSPSYLLFMDYILHMSFHIRKQGRTLNMPITAIEITNLFCGHRIRHCFRPKCFIYKTFFSKSQVENIGLEPMTPALQRRCSTRLS